MRFGPHETAAGAPSITPPRFSQSRNAVPSHNTCHIALSAPLRNMSSRLAAHDATVGPDRVSPPRSWKPLQFGGAGGMTTSLMPHIGNWLVAPPGSVSVLVSSIPHWPYAILKKPWSPQPGPHEFLAIQQFSTSE